MAHPDMSAPILMILALVLVSAWTDIRRRLIYDAFTFPAMLAGVYFAMLAGPQPLAWSLAGLAGGLLVLYPFYRIGGMGFGDLKLMGAIGALGGLTFLVSAFIDTALAGGVMAIALMARRGNSTEILGRSPQVLRAIFSRGGKVQMPDSKDQDTIPYGVAIFLGTVFAWLTHWPW